MSHGHGQDASSSEVSLEPSEGWHCSHLYYRFDRAKLKSLSRLELGEGLGHFIAALNPLDEAATARLQTSIVCGHKADFGLMLLDPSPLRIDAVHQRLMSGPLGPALEPTYSFVSMTEVSEYVPSVEQYGERLIAEGEQADSPAYRAKLKAYEGREVAMRKQRLDARSALVAQHLLLSDEQETQGGRKLVLVAAGRAKSANGRAWPHGHDLRRQGHAVDHRRPGIRRLGMGRDAVGRNPEFLKEIVYRMRFDEASARYAEFGPFYVSYTCPAAEILEHCRLISSL